MRGAPPSPVPSCFAGSRPALQHPAPPDPATPCTAGCHRRASRRWTSGYPRERLRGQPPSWPGEAPSPGPQSCDSGPPRRPSGEARSCAPPSRPPARSYAAGYLQPLDVSASPALLRYPHPLPAVSKNQWEVVKVQPCARGTRLVLLSCAACFQLVLFFLLPDWNPTPSPLFLFSLFCSCRRRLFWIHAEMDLLFLTIPAPPSWLANVPPAPDTTWVLSPSTASIFPSLIHACLRCSDLWVLFDRLGLEFVIHAFPFTLCTSTVCVLSPQVVNIGNPHKNLACIISVECIKSFWCGLLFDLWKIRWIRLWQ